MRTSKRLGVMKPRFLFSVGCVQVTLWSVPVPARQHHARAHEGISGRSSAPLASRVHRVRIPRASRLMLPCSGELEVMLPLPQFTPAVAFKRPDECGHPGCAVGANDDTVQGGQPDRLCRSGGLRPRPIENRTVPPRPRAGHPALPGLRETRPSWTSASALLLLQSITFQD